MIWGKPTNKHTLTTHSVFYILLSPITLLRYSTYYANGHLNCLQFPLHEIYIISVMIPSLKLGEIQAPIQAPIADATNNKDLSRKYAFLKCRPQPGIKWHEMLLQMVSHFLTEFQRTFSNKAFLFDFLHLKCLILELLLAITFQ